MKKMQFLVFLMKNMLEKILGFGCVHQNSFFLSENFLKFFYFFYF
jgi:hypothetical protein